MALIACLSGRRSRRRALGFTWAPPVPDGTPIAELSLPPHEETESAGGPRLGTNNAECVNAGTKSQELASNPLVGQNDGVTGPRRSLGTGDAQRPLVAEL